jgi:NADPH:quinone reductase-like Zn-dependent oxidoreductase
MRAQILKAFGSAENFELAQIPKSAVRLGTLLVRLVVTSDNAIDIKIRTGPPIGPELPAVLGGDVAGIAEEVGAHVDSRRRWRRGQYRRTTREGGRNPISGATSPKEPSRQALRNRRSQSHSSQLIKL